MLCSQNIKTWGKYMNDTGEIILKIQPELLKRAIGGWLAVSPKKALLRIGVIGLTEEEARAKFSEALKKWAEDCSSEQ